MRCPVLVHRDDELARLRAATELAAAGSGGCVLLVGDPGVGKTRLTAAVVADAEASGAVVLAGRAVRAGTPAPLRPLAEALLGWLRRHDLPAAPRLDPFRPSLARLAPQLWTGPPGEQATSLVLLGEALLRLAAEIGRERGCVLAVEDLHWADPETVAVLEYLADNAAETPLLVLASTRPRESRLVDELADSLAARRTAEVIRLRPLDGAGTDEMLMACLDGAAPPEVAQHVAAFADGVPLLVEELLAGLQSDGTLLRDGVSWRLAGPIRRSVPETLARSVQSRLEALPPRSRHVARAASMLGAEFDWTVLAPALGLAEGDVAEALRALVEAQVLTPAEGGFGFRHALTRDAVLESLLHPELVELAAGLAAALEGAPSSGDQQAVAELYELAGDQESAARAWHAGATEALRRGALGTAVEVLGRTSDLVLPDSACGLQIRETLLEAHALAGDSPAALAVGAPLVADLERLQADPDRLATVRLRLARAAYAGGLWAEADDLLASTQGLDPATTAVLRAGVALGRRHDDEAEAQARLALAEAGDVRPDVACEAWELIGRAARGRDVLQAEEAFEEAYRIAERHRLGHWRSRALQQLGTLDLVGRRPTEERLLAARAAALETGALASAAAVDLSLNLLRIRYLDLDRAMAAADDAVGLMTRLRLPALGSALFIRALTHGLAGRDAEMESDLTEGIWVAGDDVEIVAGEHAHVRGPVLLARGRYEEARAEFALGMETYRLHPGLPFSMRGLWALLETVLGDGAAAREEVRHGPQITSPHNWFALRYADAVALGRAGRGREAEQVFVDAEWAHPGREPWMEVHARGLVARAAATDGWGDPARWFRRTLESLLELGQDEAAAACRAAMREVRIPVPRRAPGSDRVPAHLHHLGVTSREYDVLELVVAGLTNQAIAERLFLSVRTVDTHVARLLQRTGCSARHQLERHLREPDAVG